MRPQPEQREKKRRRSAPVDARQLKLALVELQNVGRKIPLGYDYLDLPEGHEWHESVSKLPSPMRCEHANENPRTCPCKPGCYCKAHTCRDRMVRMTNTSTQPTRIGRESRSRVGGVVGIYAVTHSFEQSMWLCSTCAKKREKRSEGVRWRGFLNRSFTCDDCKRRSPRGKLTKR